MIGPGKQLSIDFKLRIVRGSVTREVAFRELLTRRVIVSVYMRNNTPSCDRQIDSLAAHAAEFERAGYDLIAISRDTPGAHARYAAKKAIPFTLASDPGDLFAKATDSVVEKTMYGRKFFGPARAAYVLERDGTVLAVVEKVDAADHAAQLKTLLATLK